MGSPYMGQLLLASFSFAPRGYAFCNGQIFAISQNQALFALLGTAYGGDGIQTFALPNLQGRTPIGFGPTPSQSYQIGQAGGEATHILAQSEVPGHTHTLNAATNKAGVDTPTGAILANSDANPYAPPSNLKTMQPSTLGVVGGQPHDNQQPYLVMNWCISLNGIFPSRN